MRKWLDNLCFKEWYRHFFVIQKLLELKPDSVLEIGEGSGIVHKIAPVRVYHTMDIDPEQQPTFCNDIRILVASIPEYDCVIACNILEHIPFQDVPRAVNAIYHYLKPGGTAIITIPHRVWYLFFFSWLSHSHYLIRIPLNTGRIDAGHEWEIDVGHSAKSVESIFKKVGFKITDKKKLIYVDLWTIKK